MESDDVVYADGGASRRARMGLCDQLVQDGYCRLGGVLESDMLDRLRTVTDRLLDEQSDDQHAAQRSTGSMISVTDDALFAELVAYPRALDALYSIGRCPSPMVFGLCHIQTAREPRSFLASGLVGVE